MKLLQNYFYYLNVRLFGDKEYAGKYSCTFIIYIFVVSLISFDVYFFLDLGKYVRILH